MMNETLIENKTKNRSNRKCEIMTSVIALIIGLFISGVPLSVIAALYVKQEPTSNNNQNSSPIHVNIYPSQCKTYRNETDNTRISTYNCPNCYCDNLMSRDWYRFRGSSGTKLIRQAVSNGYCGTMFPGWFNGSFPSIVGSTTIGTVCVNVNGIVCHPSFSINSILVTNCNSFYVFYLKPMNNCFSRYCTE